MDRATDKKQKITFLLRRIRENDLFALGELMELKTRDIQTIAYSVLRDEALAENIVNEVMIALIQNVHTFRNEKNIDGWINTVTIHRAFDCLKKRKYEVFPGAEVLDTAPASVSSEEQLVERFAVVEALEKLEDLERGVLVEKILNGETYAAIAVKLDLSVKQVRLLYERAKSRFREAYRAEEE